MLRALRPSGGKLPRKHKRHSLNRSSGILVASPESYILTDLLLAAISVTYLDDCSSGMAAAFEYIRGVREVLAEVEILVQKGLTNPLMVANAFDTEEELLTYMGRTASQEFTVFWSACQAAGDSRVMCAARGIPLPTPPSSSSTSSSSAGPTPLPLPPQPMATTTYPIFLLTTTYLLQLTPHY